MARDLTAIIQSLSPGGLRLFKQQMAALPETERGLLYGQLSGIPELSDILGVAPPMAAAPQAAPQLEPQPAQGLGDVMASQDVPLWQKALAGFGAPFQWIHEKAIEPFSAIVHSLWTPEAEGTAGMGWLERELEEYRSWDAPWGVKGLTETAPWLLIPGVGAVAGRAGMAGRGIAGMLGRAGAPGRAAGKALEYSPWGLTEKAAGKVLKTAAKPIVSKIAAKAAKKEAAEGAAKAATKESVLAAEKAAIGAPPPPLPKTPMQTIAEQMTAEQWGEVGRITALFKGYRQLARETRKLRKPVRAARVEDYEQLYRKLIDEGVSVGEAHKAAMAKLTGKMPGAPVSPETAAVIKQLTESEKVLFDIIDLIPEKLKYVKLNARIATQDMLLLNSLAPYQIRLLEKVFGPGLAKELLKQRGLSQQVREILVDLANMPRSFLASCDISGLLRQGAILFTRNPIEGLKAVGPSIKALLSDKNSMLMDDIIRGRPGMEKLMHPDLRIKLDLTTLPYKEAAMLTEFEEAFISRIANKIPFIRGSNRAYVTVLNDMRSTSALNVTKQWERSGLKFNPKIEYWKPGSLEYGLGDISELNQIVNWASGRGTLPKAFGLQQQGRLLSTIFFAPKLQLSRIQFPAAILPMVTKSKLARREAWRELLTFIGVGAGILTMAKASGAAEIELDPRSADFGKLKVGETRLDIWAGYVQYMRLAASLATAKSKAASGRVFPVNRMDTIMRFVQTKESPFMGFIGDLVRGETYLGEDMPPKDASSVLGQIYNRMMPLAIQDLIDGLQQDGPVGGLVASAGFFGVGVVTYIDEVKKERDRAAQDEYQMDWDEVGRELGRAAQLRLEQTTPAIIEAEKEEEERFATGSPTTMKQWHNEGESIEDTYREAIELASAEFRSTRDGRTFRDKVDQASATRRTMYAARAKRPEYQDIMAYYNQPLAPDRIAEMNPGDVLRREYYQQMFALDMYDEFGNYRFDEAETREQAFLVTHGQQALDYIEEYRGAQWLDKPQELAQLEQARDALRPYWKITEAVWAMYPPQLKVLSDQIMIMQRTDPDRALRELKRYPQILRARRRIAELKRQIRNSHPIIQQAFNLFYA